MKGKSVHFFTFCESFLSRQRFLFYMSKDSQNENQSDGGLVVTEYVCVVNIWFNYWIS
jgi:hypothetical protein